MNERISDAAAEAVLRGHVPAGSPELAPVAEAVAALRTVSFEAPPRPSADLALRLDLERAARLSTDRQHASTAVVAQPVAASTPRRGRRRVALGAFAGLGLAAKITIGAVAAAAVGVAGAGAAGAVGGLPAPAQEVFNQVTGHPGGEHVSETGHREQRVRPEDRRGGASEGARSSARPRSRTPRSGARPDSTPPRRRARPVPSTPTARARPASRPLRTRQPDRERGRERTRDRRREGERRSPRAGRQQRG